MLNDHGKSLFKPLLSVQNIVVGLAVLFFACLALKKANLSTSEWASWVQAIGSIAAIWGALRVSQMQQNNAQRLRVLESTAMAESHALLMRQASEQCSGIAQAANFVKSAKEFNMNSGRPKELFRITLVLMEAVSVRELGSPKITVLHLQMSSAMAAMYRVMQDISNTEDVDLEKYAHLAAEIDMNNFWYQSMFEEFEKEYQEKVESISSFS